ncbi:MAG: hypothetical protein ACOYMR_02520 [Ilumatobacteraceae bacterium]
MPLGKPPRPMPVPESVRDMIADLIGRSVEVDKRKAPIDLNDADAPVQTAAYVDANGGVLGACIADLSLAATVGAALAMMPSAVAEDAVRAGVLEEGLADNWHEVANVLTRLLNGPCVTHLRIGATTPGVPDDVRALTERATSARHFAVTVMGYPGGSVSFYAV